MKVFAFDPTTGKRGAQLDDIPLVIGTGNPRGAQCKLPKQAGVQWAVATQVEGRDGKRLSFDQPVCFCIGQLRPFGSTEQGEWHWFAYLPA